MLGNANASTKWPFIGSMRFGDVDGEEVSDFMISVPQRVDGRCGDAEWRSGIRAADEDEGAIGFLG